MVIASITILLVSHKWNILDFLFYHVLSLIFGLRGSTYLAERASSYSWQPVRPYCLVFLVAVFFGAIT